MVDPPHGLPIPTLAEAFDWMKLHKARTTIYLAEPPDKDAGKLIARVQTRWREEEHGVEEVLCEESIELTLCRLVCVLQRVTDPDLKIERLPRGGHEPEKRNL
ncbi:MAG: hypothetical protein AB7U73_08270 [Pirellulales bacterium]